MVLTLIEGSRAVIRRKNRRAVSAAVVSCVAHGSLPCLVCTVIRKRPSRFATPSKLKTFFVMRLQIKWQIHTRFIKDVSAEGSGITSYPRNAATVTLSVLSTRAKGGATVQFFPFSTIVEEIFRSTWWIQSFILGRPSPANIMRQSESCLIDFFILITSATYLFTCKWVW